MGLELLMIQGVDCMAENPTQACHRQKVVHGMTQGDADTAFRGVGWDTREVGWLCPPCLGAYDARAKAQTVRNDDAN